MIFGYLHSEMEEVKKRNIRTFYSLMFKSGRAVRIVNLITLYRIVTAPLLVVLIFLDQWDIFKWLLLASFSTDAIDGFLARKYKAASILGSKLDSIGDDLTVLVALIGLYKINPVFFREEAFFIILLVALFFVQLFFALYKYKKTTSFHTYLAKLAAVTQGVFLLSVFIFDTTYYPLFYAAAVITALELIEEVIIIFLLPTWKTDVRGLYWALKKKNEAG